MYAKVEDNKVIAFGGLSQILNNISIPQDADEKKFAKENGLLEVDTPDFDDFQEKLVSCEPYVKNDKIYVYSVEKMSDEEKIEIVNAHVDFELISTQWVESDKDLDKKSLDAWKSYRSVISKFKGNKDVSEISWPKRPELNLEKIMEEDPIA
jgi:hypothetical protein